MEPILMKRGPRFSTLHFRSLAKLTCSNRDTSDSVTKVSPALFEPFSRSGLKPILASICGDLALAGLWTLGEAMLNIATP